MKVSLNWLKELVDLSLSPEAVAEKLAAIGFPVASLTRTGVQASGIVAVKILSVDKHPNADRLRVAKVTDGKEERTIVCGAPNIAPGQTVPLAKPGAKLPGGVEITVSAIRGVESSGMLCSERELGISDEHAGILQLPAGTALGSDIAEAMGPPDTIFEIEVTPNRPDVLSHVGVARELAALTKSKLKLPDGAPSGSSEGDVDIAIEEPALCHRYLGRIIKGVKIGPSPRWMARRLADCGIRSINNVVDVTNYALLEWGHPLHAFDLAKLNGPAIRVRRAHAKEKFAALDERTYELSADDLVIADLKKAVAIGGVMGGQDSGVTDGTKDILLESAVFDRAAIRQTSRRLGLRSESSIRFEKGTDAESAERAWRRAARLITELAGGQPAGKRDVFPTKGTAGAIVLRRDRLAALLGMTVPEATVTDVLTRLDLAPKPTNGGWMCAVPPHRKDLVEEVDVIEEVIRLIGYEAVPASLSRFRVGRVDPGFKPADTDELVSALRGYGISETITSSFCAAEWPAKFGASDADIVRLANPISQEESILRPSLLINLLRAVARNLNHQRSSVMLFEVGRTFSPSEDERLAVVLAGEAAPRTWKQSALPVDVTYLKGLIEALIRHTGSAATLSPAAKQAFLHPGQSFSIVHRGKPAGAAGLLDPRTAAAFDIGLPCAVVEVRLAALTADRARTAAALPKYPFVERDIAVVVEKSVPWETVRSAAEKAGGPLITGVWPFDLFEGGSLAASQKSVAFRVRLQDPNKTLAEADINGAVERIKSTLQKTCGAQLR